MSSSTFIKNTLGSALICLCTVSAQAQTSATGTPAPKDGAAPTAMSGSATDASGAKLAGADKVFVEKAAMGGMAEVELGNVAAQKASSDEVKKFGARMVADHGKANAELKQIASSKGVQLPTALDGKHKKDMERLHKMSGPAFDKAYMGHMVGDHEKDVAEFKKEASSGRDAEVKAFASKTLPTLQDHLQMAQSVNDAVKKASK